MFYAKAQTLTAAAAERKDAEKTSAGRPDMNVMIKLFFSLEDGTRCVEAESRQ